MKLTKSYGVLEGMLLEFVDINKNSTWNGRGFVHEVTGTNKGMKVCRDGTVETGHGQTYWGPSPTHVYGPEGEL